MFNFQVVGFAAILAVVGFGVDYHQQSQKAKLPMGEMGASAYLDTISTRYDGVKAAKAEKTADIARRKRQKQGARVYLAEAPQGWTRRALSEGDNSALEAPEQGLQDFQQEMIHASPVMQNKIMRDRSSYDRKLEAQTWVYEKDGQLVSVRAYLQKEIKGNSISANGMRMVSANMNIMNTRRGWGVVKGVAFAESVSFDPDKKMPFKSLTANLGFGDEVILTVKSNAPDDVTRQVLADIDYDGLNSLLARPLGYVGENAPEIPAHREQEIAQQMLDLRNELLRRAGNAAEEWLMSGSQEDAMALALREVGLNVPGTLDEQDEALAEEMRLIAEKAMQAPKLPPEEHAATTISPEQDTPKSGGSSLGSWGKKLAGWMGGGAAEAEEAKPVTVRRGGSGNSLGAGRATGGGSCITEGAFKRCKVSSD